MPIRAVHVNTGTLKVDNRFDFASAGAIATQNNINPRWIGSTDWAEGQGEPADGSEWDGNIPARFAAAVVDPEGPWTLAEAKALRDSKMAELVDAQAAMDALIPLV